MPEPFIDPYLDPNTGILRNLVGATTYDELRNAEGELVTARTGEFLTLLPIKVTGILEDLTFIHRYLFQDIFEWAGEIRTVEIRKASEGSQFFLPSSNIEMGITWAKGELDKDSDLSALIDIFSRIAVLRNTNAPLNRELASFGHLS